jgi:aminopeptidase
MRDERVEKLAEMLVDYSLEIKPGYKVLIQGGEAGAPLMKSVYGAVLRAGAHPLVIPGLAGLDEIYYQFASDEQLQFVHPPVRQIIETYDARISVISESNTKALTEVDPQKKVLRSRGNSELMKIFMERAAKKELHWTVTLFPTDAHAQDAEMSLEAYEDFVYQACMPDDRDPAGYWREISRKQQKICDWLLGKKTVNISGPGTDIQFSIDGRRFENCDCHENVPDGEIFTGPVEDSAEGKVTFSFPAIYAGQEVSGVYLELKGGKVVTAKADKNEAFLQKALETDEGARRVGELAIGTNEGITRFTRQILFDEKLGGTFHMALGAGYPETGSKNESAIHWDMICDLRKGGEIRVDGELLLKDGKFVLEL